MGGKSTLGMSQETGMSLGYLEGGASCSVSTLGPNGSPIRGDGGGNPGLMEALMSVLWDWGYWEKWG